MHVCARAFEQPLVFHTLLLSNICKIYCVWENGVVDIFFDVSCMTFRWYGRIVRVIHTCICINVYLYTNYTLLC